jgi:hypothetical protein
MSGNLRGVSSIGPAREQRSFVGLNSLTKDFRAAVASTRLKARALLREDAAQRNFRAQRWREARSLLRALSPGPRTAIMRYYW